MKVRKLYVGIDVAKEIHVARIVDSKGRELGPINHFTNDKIGFDKFNTWIENVMIKRSIKKARICVGVESTGIYGENLISFLEKNGHLVKVVRSTTVIAIRNMEFPGVGKNDEIDSLVLAKAVEMGKGEYIKCKSDIHKQVKELSKLRETLLENSVKTKNYITTWLDLQFPEYKTVYSGWESKMLIAILAKYPTADDIATAGYDAIYEHVKTKLKRVSSKKKIQELIEVATNSIGRREKVQSKIAIVHHLETLEMLTKKIDELADVIVELCKSIKGVEKLMKIKGTSKVNIARMVGEFGNIEDFPTARALQSYAGLGFMEKSSGKKKSKSKISKRGNRGIRASAYRIIFAIVGKSKEFKPLFDHLKNRKENPLTGLQAIIAVCCKFVRMMFAILKHDIEFDVDEMYKGLDIVY